MDQSSSNQCDHGVAKGEFFTDGKTFAVRFDGSPITGTGDTAAAAFEDLMRADASVGALSQRLRQLARDQQGEIVRASVVRATMIGLIVLAIIGGALVTAASMTPRVSKDIFSSGISQLANWLENMPPQTEKRISGILQRFGEMTRECPAPEKTALDASE